MRHVVLASSSPRRKDLLEKAGLEFTIHPVQVEEMDEDNPDPLELARSISLAKAFAAAPWHPGSVIIAADTFGWLEGKPLGKPRDEDDARALLTLLSGKCHRVITGFTILDEDTGRSVSRAVETRVCFRELSKGEIDEYVKTGEPLDKAGAYAIQGKGAGLVERIEGDYYNVVGLPILALAEELKKFGIDLPGLSQFGPAADSPAR
jgi:septum formation protein